MYAPLRRNRILKATGSALTTNGLYELLEFD